jgi:hypothetical protein
MTLDEALEHWHGERGRLADVETWVDAGSPDAPPSLGRSLEKYKRLKKPDAKRALKELREEITKDAFLRMFSAFEAQMRAAFYEWLCKKCGTVTSRVEIDKALPAIEGVVRMAAALEPRFDQSRLDYVDNVRDCRNKLVHRGFALRVPYDLEDLHRKLTDVLALFP